jgi:hypothetical protein
MTRLVWLPLLRICLNLQATTGRSSPNRLLSSVVSNKWQNRSNRSKASAKQFDHDFRQIRRLA